MPAELGVKRQEIDMRLYLVLLVFLVSTTELYASENFCELDNKEVSVEIREGYDKSSWLRILFPKSKKAKLSRIQIRYDHIEKFGGHEVFTELAFDKNPEGYDMFIDLADDHKPLLLMATYLFGKGICYSNLYVVIQHKEIHSVRNGA